MHPCCMSRGCLEKQEHHQAGQAHNATKFSRISKIQIQIPFPLPRPAELCSLQSPARLAQKGYHFFLPRACRRHLQNQNSRPMDLPTVDVTIIRLHPGYRQPSICNNAIDLFFSRFSGHEGESHEEEKKIFHILRLHVQVPLALRNLISMSPLSRHLHSFACSFHILPPQVHFLNSTKICSSSPWLLPLSPKRCTDLAIGNGTPPCSCVRAHSKHDRLSDRLGHRILTHWCGTH